MTDADLRAYLLGQTTEANAKHIEIRALDDEDFFATVRSVEDDLFDDYARGTMPPAERPLFLGKYGVERDRLAVARALAARIPQPQVVSSRPASGRYWRMAAAAALVAGVGFALAIRSRSPEERSRPSSEVSPRGPAAPVTVALLVTLGSSRSAATPPQAILPSSARTLQLRARIDPADTFDTYAMELRSDRGIVVWRADRLHASAAGGDVTVVGDVPAASLQGATYELTVLGSMPGRAPEALGFAGVRIRR